jgi:hypothetical protein
MNRVGIAIFDLTVATDRSTATAHIWLEMQSTTTNSEQRNETADNPLFRSSITLRALTWRRLQQSSSHA